MQGVEAVNSREEAVNVTFHVNATFIRYVNHQQAHLREEDI